MAYVARERLNALRNEDDTYRLIQLERLIEIVMTAQEADGCPWGTMAFSSVIESINSLRNDLKRVDKGKVGTDKKVPSYRNSLKT